MQGDQPVEARSQWHAKKIQCNSDTDCKDGSK